MQPHNLVIRKSKDQKKKLNELELSQWLATCSQPTCNSQQPQNTALEPVGWKKLAKIEKLHGDVKIKMLIVKCTMRIVINKF